MGFSAGFTGGVTLTLGLAYLTVLAHERNRRAQADALRSQTRVLNGLFEPAPLPPPQSRLELAREERSSFTETAKDRWNEEIENAVRWVQKKDWDEVRVGMEGAVSRLLGGGLQKSRESIAEVENQAGPRVQEAIDSTKAATRNAAKQAAEGLNNAVAATVAGAERTGAAVQEGTSRAVSSTKPTLDDASKSSKKGLDRANQKTAEARDATEHAAGKSMSEAKSEAHDAVNNARGTVDAARAAVRGVVTQGIEKGKEAFGKVQAAVGLATEKMESSAQSGVFGVSPEEKALRERYARGNPLDKSVAETLEERYKPIDSRDNTVLRGV